mmetsp:Transcript_139501/g.446352  ORF Transcript_139501/g.446352 Transcript_139501/m.446352 type:complete len:106 (+) Transcript_139501:2046-2363(+)
MQIEVPSEVSPAARPTRLKPMSAELAPWPWQKPNLAEAGQLPAEAWRLLLAAWASLYGPCLCPQARSHSTKTMTMNSPMSVSEPHQLRLQMPSGLAPAEEPNGSG